MEIIPAIDIIDGKCVRLTGGDYGRKTLYHDDPTAVAREFEAHGLTRLHLVDLDGARTGRIVNLGVLERIAAATRLIIDFGGGVKRDDDIRMAFESGAAMVTGGSIAVREPETFLRWLATWGPQRLILGADARNGLVAVGGWLESAGVEVIPFVLEYLGKGIRTVISTDISRDGMLTGTSLPLYRSLLDAAAGAGFPELQLIASGGAAGIDELDALEQAGLAGVIIGKAIYEGAVSLAELAVWQEKQRRRPIRSEG